MGIKNPAKKKFIIIAGVHKAATTSLYEYFIRHPEVCAGKKKEIHYYTPLRYGNKLDDLKKYEKKFTNQEYKRILDLTVERKLPVELELVLFGGDKNEFHTHKIYPPTKTDFQIEFYLVAETQTIQLEFVLNEKKHIFKLSGPSLVIIGDVPHRRVDGECFVVKHISGNYKQIVPLKGF